MLEAIASFGRSLGTQDPATRIEELALLGGFVRLRDFDVPESELAELSAETAARPGAQANPRPASTEDIESLLRSVW